MSLVVQYGIHLSGKQVRALPPHRNAGLEIVYMAHGDVTWDYAGRQVRAPAQHLTYTWPWQEHSLARPNVLAADLYWAVLALDQPYTRRPEVFHFHPALAFAPDDEIEMLRILDRGHGRAVRAEGLLASLLPALVTELRQPGPFSLGKVRDLIRLLLVELCRAVDEAPSPLPPDAGNDRLRRFLRELESRCHEPWTLDRMAAACGLGRSQFAKRLGESTGDTPVRFLNRRRVERAQRLLARREASVTDVALECGFRTSQYFATVFRSYTQMTPSDWRLRHSPVPRPRRKS